MFAVICIVTGLLIPLQTQVAVSIPAEGIALPAPIPKVLGAYLQFNGTNSYVEIGDSDGFSVSPAGLTVMVWLSPNFPFVHPEDPNNIDKHYVYPVGKGEHGTEEWALRVYNPDVPGRQKRVSFYVFNAAAPLGQPNYGCGAYFQDDLQSNEWIHVTGVVDVTTKTVAIYKNGRFQSRHVYQNDQATGVTINPTSGPAPVRLGTRDSQKAWFSGSIAHLRIWNRALSDEEIAQCYGRGACPIPPGRPGRSDQYAAHYPLSEGTGTTVADVLHFNPNGSVVGPSWTDSKLPIGHAAQLQKPSGGCK